MGVACIALSVALSGAAYAGLALPRNSVGTRQLKNNAVTSAKVKNRSLQAVDFRTGLLSAGYTKAESDERYRTVRSLSIGVATTLAPYECAWVKIFGVGSDPSANVVVAFHILDMNDLRVPALNNETAFLPGTVFKTSQNGTLAYGQVCNRSDDDKALPQGWKVVTRQI
jgi:hypothetical protein